MNVNRQLELIHKIVDLCTENVELKFHVEKLLEQEAELLGTITFWQEQYLHLQERAKKAGVE